MRVILDTNVLISALMVRGTPPDRLYEFWREGRFQLVTSELQFEEMKSVARRPFFKDRLKAGDVGRMINDMRRLSLVCGSLPDITRSPDPDDDFLLAMAEHSDAQYLVTGDRSGLLGLGRHGTTRIATARSLVERLEQRKA